MTTLIDKIRNAQIHAGEQAVMDDLRERGLLSRVEAPNVSPEVAMGAASTRTESQAREQRIGEAGQRAFIGTIDMAGFIFLARSKVQELNQRNYISSRAFDEELIAECLTLTKGDELKARLLASAALED